MDLKIEGYNKARRLPICPLCNSRQKCLEGDTVYFCMKRVSGGSRNLGNGTTVYIHPKAPGAPKPIQPKVPTITDLDSIDAVYCAMLEDLKLSSAHTDDNQKRGISPDLLWYRTLDQDGRDRVIQEIQTRAEMSLNEIARVPGFVLKDGALTLHAHNGLLVPCRDEVGRVVALRVRRDSSDKGSRWSYMSGGGSPSVTPPLHWCHEATTVLKTSKQLVVIEGERKGEVVAAYQKQQGKPMAVVSVPGVHLWQKAGLIETAKRLGVTSLLIAYDSDHTTNPDVAKALISLVRSAKDAGLIVSVLVWSDEHKGLDDFLLAGHTMADVKQLDDVDTYLNGLTIKHGLTKELGYSTDDQPVLSEGQADAAADDQEPDDQPSSGPEMVPFPLSCLPDQLGELAEVLGQHMGVDPVMLVLPAIATIAAAIEHKRTLEPDDSGTYTVRSNFWTVVIANSGTRKSAALKEATKPLRAVDKVKYDQYQLEIQAYEQAMEEYDNLSKTDKQGKEKPVLPVFAGYICQDITIEKLAVRLQDKPSLLMVHDELNNFFGAFTRYSKDSTESQYLTLHDCGTIVVDRVNRGPTRVDEAMLGVTGGIQPAIFAKCMTGERHASGLAGRFLVAMPPRQLHRIARNTSRNPIVGRAKAGYEELIKALADMTPCTISMKFTAPAFKLYADDADERETVLHHADPIESSRLAKIKSLVPRWALIHAVCRHAFEAGRGQVELEDVQAGITFADWFSNEGRRVYGSLVKTSDALNSKQDDVVRLLAGSYPEVISIRNLVNRHKTRFPTVEHATSVVDELVSTGRCVWIEKPSSGKGRKPTKLVKVAVRQP